MQYNQQYPANRLITQVLGSNTQEVATSWLHLGADTSTPNHLVATGLAAMFGDFCDQSFSTDATRSAPGNPDVIGDWESAGCEIAPPYNTTTGAHPSGWWKRSFSMQSGANDTMSWTGSFTFYSDSACTAQ